MPPLVPPLPVRPLGPDFNVPYFPLPHVLHLGPTFIPNQGILIPHPNNDIPHPPGVQAQTNMVILQGHHEYVSQFVPPPAPQGENFDGGRREGGMTWMMHPLILLTQWEGREVA